MSDADTAGTSESESSGPTRVRSHQPRLSVTYTVNPVAPSPVRDGLGADEGEEGEGDEEKLFEVSAQSGDLEWKVYRSEADFKRAGLSIADAESEVEVDVDGDIDSVGFLDPSHDPPAYGIPNSHKSGWLLQDRTLVFQRRFAVAIHGVLHLFRSDKSHTPLVTIDLVGTSIDSHPDLMKEPAWFLLHTPKDKFVFDAIESDEMKKWVDALRICRDHVFASEGFDKLIKDTRRSLQRKSSMNPQRAAVQARLRTFADSPAVTPDRKPKPTPSPPSTKADIGEWEPSKRDTWFAPDRWDDVIDEAEAEEIEEEDQSEIEAEEEGEGAKSLKTRESFRKFSLSMNAGKVVKPLTPQELKLTSVITEEVITEAYMEDSVGKKAESSPIAISVDAALSFMNEEDGGENITWGTDGSVHAITLYKLVDLLSHPSIEVKDLPDQVLLTYPAYTTGSELLSLLMIRWKSPPPSYSDEEVKKMRTKLTTIFIQWLEIHFNQFLSTSSLTTRFLTFLSEVEADGSMVAVEVKWIRTLLRRKTGDVHITSRSETAPPDLPTLFDHSYFGYLDIDPKEIARQMTVEQARLFTSIPFVEYLGQKWTGNDAQTLTPHITAAINRFNTVTSWVSQEIVKYRKASQRAVVVARFLDIAAECVELRNFDTMVQIVTALESSPISRLKHTWAELPRSTLAIRDEMLDLFSPVENWRNYRNAVARSEPPCLPYLGLYLQQLTFSEDGNPNFVDPPGGDATQALKPLQPLINWHKFALIGDLLQQIKKFKGSNYAITPVQRLQNFLALQNVKVIREKVLFMLSCELEPRSSTLGSPKKGKHRHKKRGGTSAATLSPNFSAGKKKIASFFKGGGNRSRNSSSPKLDLVRDENSDETSSPKTPRASDSVGGEDDKHGDKERRDREKKEKKEKEKEQKEKEKFEKKKEKGEKKREKELMKEKEKEKDDSPRIKNDSFSSKSPERPRKISLALKESIRNRAKSRAKKEKDSSQDLGSSREGETGSEDKKGHKVCMGCKEQIVEGSYCTALGNSYHYPCFKCTHCNVVIKMPGKFGVDDTTGLPICIPCRKGMAPKCFHCGKPVDGKAFELPEGLIHLSCYKKRNK
eukprot:TRINITY_DN9011_c0_g1_i1.p1 TRINITY_DN9011_c0_g1~~TRINITY_DN9011_c0_g1_i1.p1  ORF type:complete len:1102 (+),score=252.09 TRINITY_DN9011_c0_g1_i1:42-3347(+)